MSRSILRIVIVAATAFQMSTAQTNKGFELGGQAGSAMRMGFSARGLAMANALSAVNTGDALSYYNPALIPFQTNPTALMSAGFLPLDRRLNYASYVQRVKPSGGFSIALINAGVSSIQGRDLEGKPTELYSTSENQLLFSFGLRPREDFAIGVSAKIFYYSLFRDVKSTTVGFDAGILYLPDARWTVAVVFGDVNSKYKWDTSQLYGRDGTTTIDQFPLRRKLAVCYSPAFFAGQIAGELEWVGSVVLSRIGTEISLHKNFGILAGIDQIDFERNINPKPTFGVVVRSSWNNVTPTVHYGFILEPYSSGGIHLLSLSVGFE